MQIHDFTPNGILHIVCCMVLCECFLGVSPSWALWKSIFLVGPNKRGGRTYPLGGCGIQVRSDTRYFALKPVDSAQGWRKKWFYVRVDQEGIPEFSTASPLARTNAWDHQLSTEEQAEAAPLLSKIGKLLGNVTGAHLIATFVKMRVWLIRARAHPMWQYEGMLDSSRMSQEELSKNELVAHVRSITSIKSSDPCNADCPVTPYGPDKPLPEVSTTVCVICHLALPLSVFAFLALYCYL